jgi:hypothetical protein
MTLFLALAAMLLPICHELDEFYPIHVSPVSPNLDSVGCGLSHSGEVRQI